MTYGLFATLVTVVATGCPGAYTTFSTWMLQSLSLFEEGRLLVAPFNLAGSLLFGVAAAAIGWMLEVR